MPYIMQNNINKLKKTIKKIKYKKNKFKINLSIVNTAYKRGEVNQDNRK